MLKNIEGQRVPDVVFKTRQGTEWREWTSAEIFDGKTVVVFSLPGAFTPTCSSAHVPRYNDLVSSFRQQGVDDVVCVSVNDAFVMDEWQAQQIARDTFPQVFINGVAIGGTDELERWFEDRDAASCYLSEPSHLRILHE